MPPLLAAAHLPPTLLVTGLATVLAVAAGRGISTLAVTAAALAGQLTVGWSNDLLDRERDRAVGRRDKPLAVGRVSARTVTRAMGVAAVATVGLSLLSGWRAAAVHLAAVTAALAYNAGLKSTPVSVVPYVLAFGALPAFVTLGLPGHPWPPAWAILAGAALGAGAHLVNALPDLADDARTGVRGLPHRLGPGPSIVLAALLLATALLAVVVGPPGRVPTSALMAGGTGLTVTAAVVVAATSGRPRWAWHLVLVAAGVALVTFLARGAAIGPP